MARASLLAAGVLAAGLGGAVLAAPASALDDLNWLAPGAGRGAALTSAPAECLAAPADAEQARLVSLGRVSFRSPALLGGLAARSGISCDTCHRNGHGNPNFFIAGVSGAPGTVDVTSAIFSRTRGDDTVNPVPIPDLTGIAGKARFGTMRPAADLHGFVHSVMVDEFQGNQPAPEIERALIAYVSALRREACPAAPGVAIDLGWAIAELDRTWTVLQAALDRGDSQVTDFVLRSLNLELGRLAQRFPAAADTAQALPELGRDLGVMRTLARDNPDKARAELGTWHARLSKVLTRLRAQEPSSLFDRAAIERFLASSVGHGSGQDSGSR